MKDGGDFKELRIPRQLCEDNTLSWTEKALLVRIASLDNDPAKGCFASARYLADFLGIKEGSLRNMLSTLRAKNLVTEVFSDKHNRGLRVVGFGLNRHKNMTDNRNKKVTVDNTEPSQINDGTVINSCTEPSQINDDRYKDISNESNSPEEQVFDFWKKTMGKGPAAKYGDKRRGKVKKRLQQGYTVEELQTAILGCSVSPYHQGENPEGRTYDDLELICRDETKTDSFISIWENYSKASASARDQSVLDRCVRCNANRGMVFDLDGNPVKCSHDTPIQKSQPQASATAGLTT